MLTDHWEHSCYLQIYKEVDAAKELQQLSGLLGGYYFAEFFIILLFQAGLL
jgi:hypothetical protein